MAKQRISLTLKKDLVEKIDTKVKAEDHANRSQAIETFLTEHLHQKHLNTAVILCGGDKQQTECMIRINGKPVLQHTIEHLDNAGIDHIFLAKDADNDTINDHFGNGKEYNLTIDYIDEKRPLGTAGCLRRLQDQINDSFLLMNGDVLCKVDLDDMASAHRDDDVFATMALTTVQDTSPYGVVKLKGDRVIGFTQKQRHNAPSNLINAGVYIMEPDVIDMLPSENEEQKIQVEELFDKLAEHSDLKGYVYEGNWQDLGS